MAGHDESKMKLETKRHYLVGPYEALKKGIFITASCLIIFIALRNSLIWHVEQCWGASKNFWSSIWAVFYWLSGENFFNMYIYGVWLLGIFTFTIGNIFFLVLDLTGKPSVFLRYKIQEDKGVPVSWMKYKKALWRCAFNIVVVVLLFQLVMYPLAVLGRMHAGYELPTFATTVLHFTGYMVIEEIGFYYTHRLFHHPWLYKYIHKTHHEWTAPTGITSVYSHPLEHFVGNLGPMGLGPIIMGSHVSIACLWIIIAVVNTTISHSGYHLPFLPSSEAHDFHHLKFNQNYGVFGVLDRLHGTDEQFRQSKNYERHIVLLGLNPAKQLFPNTQKRNAD
ncbi:fatty acid hydroxylase domain-containing protein 2-like [Halichondria panicea]|uniref:fatty acid hydroxylase domain-containing protein 2-like n=1 Tax=Halichondria panicea TaxID=6063 RepID=UPI00312B2E61